MKGKVLFAALAAVLVTACAPNGAGDAATTTDSTTAQVPTSSTATSAATGSTTTVASTTTGQDWPDPIAYQEAIFDPVTDSIMMVGGCEPENCDPVAAVWTLDLAHMTFSQLADMPFARGNTPLVYDEQSDAIIALEVAFLDYENDHVGTWIFDRDSTDWTPSTTEPQPRLGIGARMAYDSQSDLVVAFGGQAFDSQGLVSTDETWAYDTDTDTWVDKAPTTHPSGINYSAFVYDRQSDLIVLYGLADRGETQLWTYDVDTNTWTELDSSGAPELTPAYARGLYQGARDLIFFFGGWVPSTDDVLDEVWAFDVDANKWQRMGDNPITGLIDQTWTYADSLDRAVAFGGGPSYEDFFGNRLLLYDPNSDSWEEVLPGAGS